MSWNFREVDALVNRVEAVMDQPVPTAGKLKTGVDLGTADIVITVLDENNQPVACAMEFAQVIKDGLVVDYIGCMNIVKRLKEQIEEHMGKELSQTAIAVPPGTGERDTMTHRYVTEGAGFEVAKVIDEPTAANAVMGIKNGAVVDIGGGTTGISIFQDGQVVYTADEATGGTHLSLVLSGRYHLSFDEAERMKKEKIQYSDVFTAVTPVLQKMGSIVKRHIADFHVEGIFLVGGTSCLDGIERIIRQETGVQTFKPQNPLLITPLGIAMNCPLVEKDVTR